MQNFVECFASIYEGIVYLDPLCVKYLMDALTASSACVQLLFLEPTCSWSLEKFLYIENKTFEKFR